MLTQKELLSVLDYDKNSGIFTWKTDRNGGAVAGDVAGCLTKKGYIQIRVLGSRYFAHRLAWLAVYGKFPSEFLDHKNNNKQDNRICNLREATRNQNMQNRPTFSNNTSGLKGARFESHCNKWRAQIYLNGKNKHLGLFDTAEEAHSAYCSAAKLHYKEFANLG